MSLVGISHVATDWRMRIVTRKGFSLYSARQEHARAMEQAGLRVTGILEVALWEDLLAVRGSEAFDGYLVDNQAIVVPETIDAIRALTELDRDPRASIEKTNRSLGISNRLLKQAA